MKVLLMASALGLLLLAGACSPHRGHYGGGGCGSYWSNSPASVQDETLRGSYRLHNYRH